MEPLGVGAATLVRVFAVSARVGHLALGGRHVGDEMMESGLK